MSVPEYDDTEKSQTKRHSSIRVVYTSSPGDSCSDGYTPSPHKYVRKSYQHYEPVSYDKSLNHSLNTSALNNSTDSPTGYNSSPATTPVGRDNKAGWYDIHDKHVRMASRLNTTLVLCGDSIVAGLSRYPKVWSKYFRPISALNMGIGGDRTQHVLWRAENINLPLSVEFIVLHCGTNNIDRDQPIDIANGVASVGVAFQEKRKGLKIIITGLLPRDLNESFRREKITKTNKYLKRLCRHKLKNFYFMKQDNDWILEDGTLNTGLYYDDCLHLIETGNDKFAKSIINAYYRIKENNFVYSDDESDTDTDMEKSFTFERQLPEKRRKRHRSPSVEHSHRSSSSRKRRRSYSDDNRNKSPKRKSRSPYKLKKVENDMLTPNKWSNARKWNKIIKEEFHDKFSKMNSKDSSNNDKLSSDNFMSTTTVMEGTAKSIDISLDEQRRREARKSKFGFQAVPTKDLAQISALSKAELQKPTPSALVRRIQTSQLKARQELSDKKRNVEHKPTLVEYESPSSIDEKHGEEKYKKNYKKFFSDYGSGSESELDY